MLWRPMEYVRFFTCFARRLLRGHNIFFVQTFFHHFFLEHFFQMVAMHRLTISHFLWCPIWGSSANKKKCHEKMKNTICSIEKPKFNVFSVDGKTLEILHTLFWGWLDIDVVTKKGESKRDGKKAEMKKGRKKFNGWSGQCFSLHNHVYRPKIIWWSKRESILSRKITEQKQCCE